MKKTYNRPEMMVEQYEANEYVAACGDTEYGAYKFVCDAGGGAYGTLYRDSNGNGKLDGNDKKASCYTNSSGGFHACGETHEADKANEFVNGFLKIGDEVTPVIIWFEEARFWGGTYIADYHATTNLNQDSWETARS